MRFVTASCHANYAYMKTIHNVLYQSFALFCMSEECQALPGRKVPSVREALLCRVRADNVCWCETTTLSRKQEELLRNI